MRHLRRVLAEVGVVQLDAVNVVARAHESTFFTRLGPYPRHALDRWLATGETTEYRAHEASILPAADRPLLAWWMASWRPGRRTQALLEADPRSSSASSPR